MKILMLGSYSWPSDHFFVQAFEAFKVALFPTLT